MLKNDLLNILRRPMRHVSFLALLPASHLTIPAQVHAAHVDIAVPVNNIRYVFLTDYRFPTRYFANASSNKF